MRCDFTVEELKLIATACSYMGELFKQIGVDAEVDNDLNFKDNHIVSENLKRVEHKRWLLNNKLQNYISQAKNKEDFE